MTIRRNDEHLGEYECLAERISGIIDEFNLRLVLDWSANGSRSPVIILFKLGIVLLFESSIDIHSVNPWFIRVSSLKPRAVGVSLNRSIIN
jgi:hypothetical protein